MLNRMKTRGFTLIELMITMVIITILMVVAVVSLRSTQANGRDSERRSDTETIARGLENRYTRGTVTAGANPPGCGEGDWSCSTTTTVPGYPSIKEINNVKAGQVEFGINGLGDFTTENLPGVSRASLQGPSGGSFVTICGGGGPSCGTPENMSAVTAALGPSKDNYVYEPLTRDGALCQEFTFDYTCGRFNLYYFSEVKNSIQTIRSKHQ